MKDEYVFVINPTVANATHNGNWDFAQFLPFGDTSFTAADEFDLAPFSAKFVWDENMISPPSKSIAIVVQETGAKGTAAEGNIVSVRYFNLQGIEVIQPVENNIYIVKTLFESNKVAVSKTLFKK